MTTKQAKGMVLAYQDGMAIAEICKTFGLSTHSLYDALHMHGEPMRKVRPHRNRYIVHDAKGHVVVSGTADECAAAMGIQERCFFTVAYQCKIGKNRKWKIARKLENDSARSVS